MRSNFDRDAEANKTYVQDVYQDILFRYGSVVHCDVVRQVVADPSFGRV